MMTFQSLSTRRGTCFLRLGLMLWGMLILPFSGYSQSCYTTFFNQGIEAYNELDFEKAIKQFEAAKECADQPRDGTVEDWINKAQNGYIDAIKKERNRARSLALTARSILELEKNHDAAKAFRYAEAAIQLEDNTESRSALYASVYHLNEVLQRRLFAVKDLYINRDLFNGVEDLMVSRDGRYWFMGASFEEENLIYSSSTGEKIGQIKGQVMTRYNYCPHQQRLALVQGIAGAVYDFTDGELNPTPLFTIRHDNDLVAQKQLVNEMIYSPDGSLLIAGFSAGRIQIHSADGQFLQSFNDGNSRIKSMDISADNTTLLTADDAGRIRLYEREENGSFTKKLEYKENSLSSYIVFLSPDKQHFAVTSRYRGVILRNRVGELILQNNKIEGVNEDCFSSNGKMIVLGKEVYSLETGTQYAQSVYTLNKEISRASFSPNDEFIIGMQNNMVWWWEKAGSIYRPYARTGVHGELLVDALFAGESNELITLAYDQNLKVWEPRQSIYNQTSESQGILSVSAVEDSLELMTIKENEIHIWNDQAQQKRYLKLPVTQIYARSPDGKRFLVTNEQKLEVWAIDLENSSFNMESGRTFEGEFIAQFSGKDQVAVFQHRDVIRFILWDLNTHDWRYLSGFEQDITTMAWSPDARYIALGSYNGKVAIWDTQSEAATPIRVWPAHPTNRPISFITYAPDGQSLATGSWDTSVKLWSTTGDLLSTIHDHSMEINTVFFSPDQRFILTGGKTRLPGSGMGKGNGLPL